MKKAIRERVLAKEKVLTEEANWKSLFAYVNRFRGSKGTVGPLK